VGSRDCPLAGARCSVDREAQDVPLTARLGLALSKRLIEAMGGEIAVDTMVGRGSSFRVELPVEQAPISTVPAEMSLNVPAPSSSGTFVVLYIEDNVANLHLIERVLALRPSVKLLVAMHGQLGIEMAQQHQPHLVLLDLHLPDPHGCQVIGRLRDAMSRPRL
jgi:PleD family two-component response regulator